MVYRGANCDKYPQDIEIGSRAVGLLLHPPAQPTAEITSHTSLLIQGWFGLYSGVEASDTIKANSVSLLTPTSRNRESPLRVRAEWSNSSFPLLYALSKDTRTTGDYSTSRVREYVRGNMSDLPCIASIDSSPRTCRCRGGS